MLPIEPDDGSNFAMEVGAITRPLSTVERERLQYLLSVDFPGVENLRLQAEVALAIPTREPDTILFALPPEAPKATVVFPQPVVGHCMLGDIPVELELFVAFGRLHLMGFVVSSATDPESYDLRDPRSFSLHVAESPKKFRKVVAGTLPDYQR